MPFGPGDEHNHNRDTQHGCQHQLTGSRFGDGLGRYGRHAPGTTQRQWLSTHGQAHAGTELSGPHGHDAGAAAEPREPAGLVTAPRAPERVLTAEREARATLTGLHRARR
ncbi:hypothetical protein Abr02nite_46760 [Paractinoplanes brasiliensis]|nr:hypothetical protein Abr02nite_46760 [Actinoplanes brasiliensis]